MPREISAYGPEEKATGVKAPPRRGWEAAVPKRDRQMFPTAPSRTGLSGLCLQSVMGALDGEPGVPLPQAARYGLLPFTGRARKVAKRNPHKTRTIRPKMVQTEISTGD